MTHEKTGEELVAENMKACLAILGMDEKGNDLPVDSKISTADIKYIPAENGAEYTAISAAAVTHSALDMLTFIDVIGEVDIFGEVATSESIKEAQQLRRSRAAGLLRRVAVELDAYDAK